MAVTQQIARLTPEQLAECRRSVQAIDRLCSFELLEKVDHVDLNWAPKALEEAAAFVAQELAAAIREACDGGEEVNPAYRDLPGTIWEHPVTALEPADVRRVAAVLAGWSGGDLEAPGDVRERFDALRRFYAEATERGLATVMWWD